MMHAARRNLGMVALTAAALGGACSNAERPHEFVQAGAADPAGPLFTPLPARVTGVPFENRLRETRELNVFTYRNFYNGGGVALGDLTGNGLPDLVLTSNQEGARLYLNRGDFRFDDVTGAAGLRTAANSWTTGIALADVNGDGQLDLYISRAGLGAPAARANQLWIHQGLNAAGVPVFREMAAQYGVADEGYSTHAVFFDYDGDGDLDLFVINNSPQSVSSFGVRNTRHERHPYGGAKLFRNDGGRFVDVSATAGIHGPEIAFALGVVAADVNRDGWPDLYVANDFFEMDYLYLNNGDGTFRQVIEQQMPVISHFSMGMDIADVDDDGWPDVYTTDMLPEDDYRLKTTSTFETWGLHQSKIRAGFHHQFMRNMLQRNNGNGTFSDIGHLAGVARTDWSWTALVADLDLDGRKDIFVTNGMAKDVTAQDYLAYLASEGTMRAVTSGGRTRADFERLTRAMPSTPLPNYAFRNEGGWQFSSVATAWGLATPGFSSGAAYGDLDGDGALDLVVNNANAPVSIYRNNARTIHPDRGFLRVRLEGAGANRFGIGARVTLYVGGDGSGGGAAASMQEQQPSRGFQSSVDYVLAFGLGAHPLADSIRVEWPDGAVSLVQGVARNETVTIRRAEAIEPPRPGPRPAAPHLARPRVPLRRFVDVTESVNLPYRHRENEFVDFDRERLIPKLLSTESPRIAVGDVNGDGLDDLFIGGSKGFAGQLLLQRRDGRFESTNEALFERDAISEDLGAVFFDANGNGRLDLYVVSGGNEFSERAPALEDRLYLNQGNGVFRKAEGQLPAQYISGSTPAAADYDGDGDVDLFVGGRVIPWRYGLAPRSTLLRNDGRGRFTDVTEQLAPQLAQAGMVTDAVWADVDGDGRLDLVVVGEWMPVTVFRNAGGGRLERWDVPGLERSHGWWNRVIAGDFTGNGRVDFVVGNLGLNTTLRASATEPTTMHVSDFNGNGFLEQIVSVFSGGTSYPMLLRDELLQALPFLRPRFPTYKDYAQKTVTDIFLPGELANAHVLSAHTFATTLVRNDGGGRFTMVPLPVEAQVAPVYGMFATDVDGDGVLDLLLAGNFDGFKTDIGRQAAGYGLVLRGSSDGTFTAVEASESGFFVPGQARDIKRVVTAQGPIYVVARNNEPPLIFRAAPR